MLRLKNIWDVSAGGGVAGGKKVSRSFWPGADPARAEGKQPPMQKREGVVGGAAQKSTAGKNGVREINVTFVLGSAKGGIHGPGGGLGKIINEKAGKNLLENEFRLLCMEVDQAYGVFQTSEGSLNTPAHGVELSQDRNRELPVIQVGNKGFRFSAGSFQSDDTDG